MIAQATLPDERTAARIFGTHFADGVSRVTRFPTGLCHYVFEVVTTNDTAFVVRIASRESRPYMDGGLYWHPSLKAAGVPVPALHASGVDNSCAYMLLERLPGSDLGLVYGGLSRSSKRSLAEAVAGIQRTVSTLPKARGFGFAFSYEQANATGKSSWAEVVREGVSRSEERIRRVGRIDLEFVERVRAILARHETYLHSVQPVPFLDDMTTKNVIVDDGALSGIVDTDEVCFGDPLSTVALTNMALLSLGVDTEYIDFWLDAMQATRQQRAMMLVYSIVCCLDFMGELGQVFNKHVEFSEERAEHLRDIFEKLAGIHSV